MSLTLKFTWSLVSGGCAQREERGRLWREIREIIFNLTETAEQVCARVCVCASHVCVHALYTYMLAYKFVWQRETHTHSLFSLFFFFFFSMTDFLH